MIGTLEVTVLRATNVKNKDFYFTTSDPYVKVSLHDLSWSTYIADLTPENNSAIWNERLTFNIENAEQLKGNLIIEMFDKDKFGADDILFTDKITIALHPEKEFLEIVKLEHEGTTLEVVVHYLSLTIMQKIYAKLDKIKEEFKKKLINQIMDKLTGIFTP